MEKFEQILTTAMISIMSFFGWNIEEQKEAIPSALEKVGENINEGIKKLPLPDFSPVEVKIPSTLSEEKIPQKQTPLPSTPTPSTTHKPTPTPQVTVQTPPSKPNVQVAPKPAELPKNQNVTAEQKIKSAVGNIFCTIIEAGRVRKITGSAVAISNNGVMLTNAHVAEYIMLENTKAMSNISCFVRTGSPAARAYKASVIYLPSEWVSANKDNMKYAALSGTGENDYALIVLNEKVTGSTAPDLSFIEGNAQEVSVGSDILLAGYPAFGGNIIDNALYSVVEKSQVKDIWRLNRSNSDLMGTAPTILAAHGSSGGAAASPQGKLLGIIVATTADTYTGKPNLRLISFNYISKDIESKTRKTLSHFIKHADSESVAFISGEGARLSQTLILNSR